MMQYVPPRGVMLDLDPKVVCVSDYARTHRHTSQATKRAVYRKYGVPQSEWKFYRLDHFLPIEIGGEDTADNLWPELIDKAKAKDLVENQARRDLCSGKYTIKQIRARFDALRNTF